MKNHGICIALAAAGFAALASESIHVVPCPKCDKRMRILPNLTEANINVSRLQDDAPDDATLARRIDAMRNRAGRMLARAAKRGAGDRNSPLMGWSSWNTFAVEISEDVIVETARAMAANGLKDAGYLYVNIDDGFFYGHGPDGKLQIHPVRFPNGLKPVVDAIHALGMRAGIYSDAGADTCGSGYNGDSAGIGAGLYGHDKDDCDLYFRQCDFDFIKVDYCGGKWLKLDEKARYTEVSEAIREAGGGKVRFNICRWDYPGTWVAGIADSWRTTQDIRANWKSVKNIIGQNLYLSAFASPGHFNDLDMLEVGHRLGKTKTKFTALNDTGLTIDEEKTHFGMWCMLSSPLLIGCDVRELPDETKKLVTNPFLVAMNQNDGIGVQAYVVRRVGDAYVLVKDAEQRFGKSRYVALYNAGDTDAEITLNPRDLDLAGEIAVFDLVDMADVGVLSQPVVLRIKPHDSRFFLLDAEKRLERTVYEAETAFLSDYQELHDPEKAGTAFFKEMDGASGGIVVANLGGRESNDLVWNDVMIFEPGDRELTLRVASPQNSTVFLQIDAGAKIPLVCESSDGFTTIKAKASFTAGRHTIRLSNPTATAPYIDFLRIE